MTSEDTATVCREAESTFSAMQTEWKALQAELTQVTLVAWESSFREMVDEQQRLIEQGKWICGPVDLMSIMGRSRHELNHCSMVAWLMEPRMPHGLGTAFLHGLLSTMFPVTWTEKSLKVASCVCEVVAPHSRADIVVTAPNLTIIFEAKVDAAEQPRQCERLYEDHQDSPGSKFVFLTPWERKPNTDTADVFEVLSFRTVRTVLEDIVAEGTGTSAPGAAAVQSYLETLRKEFP